MHEKKMANCDDFGVRSPQPVVQKPFHAKRAASIVGARPLGLPLTAAEASVPSSLPRMECENEA